MLKGKTVLLGVSGSIAAYKIANLARLLKKNHAAVHVLMTEHAVNFITPTTFETLTGTKCLIDTFDRNFEFSVEHVALAKQADKVIVLTTSDKFGKRSVAKMLSSEEVHTIVTDSQLAPEYVEALRSHQIRVEIAGD